MPYLRVFGRLRVCVPYPRLPTPLHVSVCVDPTAATGLPVSISMETETLLRDALSDDGDLELRFQGGEAIPIHSQKLKLASTVLKDTITAVLDDLIASASAKRRRTAEGSSGVAEQCELPNLQVSLHASAGQVTPYR